MRKVAFAAIFAASVGFCGAASATDLSHKDTPAYEYSPVVLWTGPYIGGHIGGAWGDTQIKDTFDYYGDPTVKSKLSSSGAIGGVQLGYNFQRGRVVYGIEGDLGWLNLSGSKSAHLQDYHKYKDEHGKWHEQFSLDSKYSISGGLYGDLTGRLGYAANNALFYLKGGAAFLNIETDARYIGGNCTTRTKRKCDTYNPSKFDFEHSETLWGWTIGAGIEYAISPSLSLKAEYQHFDFGGASFSYNRDYYFSPVKHPTYHSTLEGKTEVSPTVDAVTVGVNYRLNGTDATLK